MNLAWITYNGGVLTRNNDTLGVRLADGPHHALCQYYYGSQPMPNRWDTLTQVDPVNNIWDAYLESDDWSGVFGGNTSTSLIRVIDADLTGVTNTYGMFYNCQNLYDVNLRNTSSITYAEGMFNNCHYLTVLNMDGVPSLTQSTRLMFYWCNRLRTIPTLDTSRVENMSDMFWKCKALETVPFMDTSSVTNMEFMFAECKNLTTVPLFDTSSVTTMSYMFNMCGKLKVIPLFDTSSVTSMNNMFEYCTLVETGALALYQQASTQATPPSGHFLTFRYCGSDTVTGAAELDQIPRDWK